MLKSLNRRKREQRRAQYDTPRTERVPTVEQRRVQLATNICRIPAARLPAQTLMQLWALRPALLIALDEVSQRSHATVTLATSVGRYYGFEHDPETMEAIARDVGVKPSTVNGQLQRAYEVMHAWLATNHPALLVPVAADVLDQDPLFWSKVQRSDDPDGCWIWTGATDLGYGVLKRQGKKLQAHRYAYTLAKGNLTPGLHLIHRCGHRLCVNPDHLCEVSPGHQVADVC
ncbi:MAG: hypothetical protein EI684_21480 [Candidatus Viridilinea halotolerans]|uniref:HNH nuclease domain-containing protein n=1 Tax=Candidatus Viridilinea halotolerans TaxID=2491704 RepID=A0A426TRF8_9CHLR|nr:MAG: hypothetical protein EI684_21480 [Candidatus Viridilinea halotolerans]